MNLENVDASCFMVEDIPTEFVELVKNGTFRPGVTFTSPKGFTYQFTNETISVDWLKQATIFGKLPVERIFPEDMSLDDPDIPDPLKGFVEAVTEGVSPRSKVLLVRADTLMRFKNELNIEFKLT